MPAIIELDRPARQGSSLQQGSTFVDRLRTRLVQREILKRLARSGSLRFLDLGCGYHATCLRAIHKAIGDRLAEGLGVDFQVGEESRRHPRLRFVTASVEDALPELPCNAFDAVLKPGGRLLVNVPPRNQPGMRNRRAQDVLLESGSLAAAGARPPQARPYSPVLAKLCMILSAAAIKQLTIGIGTGWTLAPPPKPHPPPCIAAAWRFAC